MIILFNWSLTQQTYFSCIVVSAIAIAQFYWLYIGEIGVGQVIGTCMTFLSLNFLYTIVINQYFRQKCYKEMEKFEEDIRELQEKHLKTVKRIHENNIAELDQRKDEDLLCH